jgi:hypothetical protein
LGLSRDKTCNEPGQKGAKGQMACLTRPVGPEGAFDTPRRRDEPGQKVSKKPEVALDPPRAR